MNFKHGHSRNPLYPVWRTMIQRCHNPKNHKYSSYGNRGIFVCLEWRDSFEKFLLDMGPRPNGSSIERKNNNEGYNPRNCVWATPKQQASNRRKITHCKRGHELTKPNGCTICQRERNKSFMRKIRKENPKKWRKK